MKLGSGFELFVQQYKALFWKNVLLSWRNKKATFFQLFASFLFIFLIFVTQKAIDARFSYSTSHRTLMNPQPLVAPPIPPCEDKFYLINHCFDFIWSGNGSARIQRIVAAIMENNPGRPIPSTKVKSFESTTEVDEWLFSNPMLTPGALHFAELNATAISYGIQTNSTPLENKGNYEDPTFKFQIPLQIAAEREIARSLIGDPNFSWMVSFKEFAHPKVQSLSAMTTVGPPFFIATAMFGFVLQMSSLVVEKELKLRQAMTMMGLYDSAYWLSCLTWEGILTFASSLLILLFGKIFDFDFFLNNSSAVVFLVLFLFQINMLGFAFMLSAFISNSSASPSVGFTIFIVSSVNQLLGPIQIPYSRRISKPFRVIWSLFPPNLFNKAVYLLADATSTPQDIGISWSRKAECTPNDNECVITISDIYKWFVATFILWIGLAIYFDNIIPNEFGVRKSAFYFLKPQYWTGRNGKKREEGAICSCIDSLQSEEQIPADDEDVLEEENIIKQHIGKSIENTKVAVQIRGLVKTYPGSTKLVCFKCKRTQPFHALKGLWVNFARKQLFCLIGTSGAGKTSVINCLTGITPATGGDALIYGNSIQSSSSMSRIRKLVGVCPQFDILWDALSAEEHLHIFSSIKGIPPASIQSVIQNSLEEVRLTEAANVRAGSYSGGMRRRLSLAISFIGDPKLVILDEPTTGIDPITRRHVWDIIQEAKKERAILLTTHSMEEADILSDRIGIMANGKLRCIGSSAVLKSRFGNGSIVHVSFIQSSDRQTPPHNGDVVDTTQQRHETVKLFFKRHLDVLPKEENDSSLTFAIPRNREMLFPDCFTELQDRQNEFGIADFGISFTSLEEVFLSIARQAELETAIAEGRLVTITLTSGLSLEIPVGAKFVGIPGTESAEDGRGIMVEVHWKQDELGALCVSKISDEIPIPLNVESMAPLAATPSRNSLDRTVAVRGVVIDPNQILGSNYH
ncbi:ABC transporter A family member 2-like [Humulus lupulus]|uniref:ABC transporter A family member 2-like n=1 Tax=Humulus lupulus TaxID=3486 RepID=UPI002B418573|nr:ABC transporter A family member 2-like [Humulus lupulus]